jgi:hypothetical protein
MGEVITIGLDIAKSVFQVHGVDDAGTVVIRKRVSRSKMLEFFAELAAPKCFPNLASFRHVNAESALWFFKKDETFQESQGILSPLRLPIPPRPL